MLISLVPTALAADRSELEDHWASESLLYFADEGWLQGYKDGTYRPDSKISRAEFLTILNRVCGFTHRDDEAAKRFTDVKETDWYFEQVSIALAAGYTNGTSAYAGVVSATDFSIDTSGGVVFLFYVFTGILFSVRPPVAPSFVARRKIGEKGVPRGCGPLNPLGLMFWRILTCCVPTFSQRCI